MTFDPLFIAVAGTLVFILVCLGIAAQRRARKDAAMIDALARGFKPDGLTPEDAEVILGTGTITKDNE